MARFIPKLARHVLVIFPGFVGSLSDDSRHHLGDVDLTEPFVKHHQRLWLWLEGVVVKERLGVDSHVVWVGETFIAPWNAIVCVRLDGVLPVDRVVGVFLFSSKAARISEAIG